MSGTAWRKWCGVLGILLLIVMPRKAEGHVDVAHFSVLHFNTENGLPQNSVKGIVADETGFIWMATEAGLVRYDGRTFSVFNKFNTGMNSSRTIGFERSPYNNRLQAITENFIFLELFQSRIGNLDGDVEKLFPAFRNTPKDYRAIPVAWIKANAKDVYGLQHLKISIDASNAIVLDHTHGLLSWYKDNKEIRQYDMPSRQQIRYIFSIDRSVYIPLSSPDALVLRCYTEYAESRVRLTGDILKDKDYSQMVFLMNPAMRQVFVRNAKKLYQVFRSPDGNLNTVLLLDGFDFPKNQVVSVYHDTESGRIFLGSTYNGLYILLANSFETKTSSATNLVAGNVYYHQVAVDAHTVLTGRGVLFDDRSDKSRASRLIDNGEEVREFGYVLHRDAFDRVWQGGAKSVSLYNKDVTKKLNTWPRESTTTAIAGISENEVWLGTKWGEILSLNPNAYHEPVQSKLKLGSYIYCILRRKDDVWIGTQNELYRYNLSSGLLNTAPRLHRKVIRNIYADTEGNIWICTYEDGLFLYRNNKYTSFPKDKKKNLNSVHAIIEDAKGFFWLSTNGGIFQVKKKDLIDYADNLVQPVFYLKYEHNAGFLTNEFNGGGRDMSVVLDSGYSTFSSMNGLVFFKPGQIKPELPDAPLIIDFLTVDNDLVPVKDTVQIDRAFNNMSVHLSTPYFGNPDNLVLEYKIDGSAWLPVDNGVVVFNQFSAGRHLLQTRKRSGFGNIYVYGPGLVINVPLAYYETFMFKLFAVLAGLSVVGLLFYGRLIYHKKKNKKLEKAVAERTADLNETIIALQASETNIGKQLQFQEQLSQNIAHDIRTPLKYLVIASQYMSDQVKRAEMPGVQDAAGLHLSAERIYNYTNSLTNYLKAKSLTGQQMKPLHLHSLIEEKRETFALAARLQEVVIHNRVCPGYDLHTHPELFEILIHNLVDNAIKNTSQGTVEIRNEMAGDQYILVVEDSGAGLPAEQIDQYNTFFTDLSKDKINNRYVGFGFLFMRDVQSLLQVRITLAAAASGGLSVSVLLYQPEA